MLNGSGYASSFLDHLGVLGGVNLKSLTRGSVENAVSWINSQNYGELTKYNLKLTLKSNKKATG